MYQLLSIISGMILSVMVSINGNLSDRYGVLKAAVIIHIVGVLFALLLCFVRKEKRLHRKPSSVWIYLGGAIGVITTFFNNLSFGHISMTSLIALGLLGQMVTGMFIDHLGLFGMKKRQFQKDSVIGILLAITGIFIMLDSTVTTTIYATVLSVGAGVSVVMARTVNARLSQEIGPLQGSLVNHLVGLPITLVVALLVTDHPVYSGVVSPVRPWIYCGGMIGVIVVLLCNIVVPKLPAFHVTVLTFTGQLFTGIVLDLVSGERFSDASFRGGIIIALGVVVNMILEYLAIQRSEKEAAYWKRLKDCEEAHWQRIRSIYGPETDMNG